MNNEIKEIIDLLNFNKDTISNGTCRVEDFMSRKKIIKLLDYITNLQEENKQLKELKYKFFDCSGDEESFTLEDYLELGNKLYDLQEENIKLNIKLEDKAYEQLKVSYKKLQEENDDLKNRLENATADCNLRLQENERLKDKQKRAYIFVKKLHEKLKDVLKAPFGIREMSMLEEMLKEEDK